jgi:hypothetical protein
MILRGKKRTAPKPNPYVGPRAFRHGDPLYGREREVLELTDLLIAERIVLLHAPSGAGKTSLIQAAVVPALEKEGFRVSGHLRVNAVPPTGSAANTYAWSVIVGLADDESANPNVHGTTTITDFLDAQDGGSDGREHVLIFDQFEEILTLAPGDKDGQRAFFEDLGSALENFDRWALFSIREDYMGGLAMYESRIPSRLHSRYRLDFLSPDAAREACQKPAESAGVEFTNEAAQAIVDDLSRVPSHRADKAGDVPGPYVEPVYLQVACHRLWRKLDRSLGGKFLAIERQHLGEFGGLDKALSSYYKEMLAEVADETSRDHRAIRDWFDSQLISDKVYRVQTQQPPDVEEPEKVLEALERHYLIRKDTRGTPWYEIAHDRLVRPIRKNNEDWRRRHLDRWEFRASEWDRGGRDDSYLLSVTELREAKQWVKDRADKGTDVERAFVAASRKDQEGQRLQTMFGLAMFWLSLLGLICLAEFVVIVVLLDRT